MQTQTEKNPTSERTPQVFGAAAPTDEFVERRTRDSENAPHGIERRQFQDRGRATRPEAIELAEAIDAYKVRHRRRFITFEELFDVVLSLGYHK